MRGITQRRWSCPTWHRTMRRVAQQAMRAYRTVDIRFRYIKADRLGGAVESKYAGGAKYNRPIIEIAHLNRLGGQIGVQVGRTGRNKRSPRRRTG